MSVQNQSLAHICVRPHRANRSLASRIAHALDVARSRRALARLDAALLDDIGLTERQARNEANRPAWDAPHSWTRN